MSIKGPTGNQLPPEENIPGASKKEVQKGGRKFLAGAHRFAPQEKETAKATENVEQSILQKSPDIGTNTNTSTTKTAHRFKKETAGGKEKIHEEIVAASVEKSSASIFTNLSKKDFKEMEKALKKFAPPTDEERLQSIKKDASFRLKGEKKSTTERLKAIDHDVDFDSEEIKESPNLKARDKKRLERIAEDVDFGEEPLQGISQEIEQDVNFDIDTPPPPDTHTKIATILSNAINNNDVARVRQIIDMAKEKNVDMKPIIAICINSPQGKDLNFLLILKTVLTASNQTPDLRQLNSALDKAFSLQFKEAIKQDDKELLATLITKAEKHHPDPVLQSFAKRILDKFEALQKHEGKELQHLEPLDMLKMCAVAELHLYKGSTQDSAVHLKKTDEGLSHSLLIDHTKQSFTILLNDTIARGGFGKVKASIEVAHNHMYNAPQVESTVRKVNLPGAEMSPKELAFEKKYGDMKSYANYTSGAAEKTTFTMNRYTCNLFQLDTENELEAAKILQEASGGELPQMDILDVVDKCRVLYAPAKMLARMHSDGVIHNDIKGENILFRRGADGHAEGRLSDFGLSYEPEKVNNQFTSYGTIPFHAPEVLKDPEGINPNLSGLNAKKAQDAYALGCTAYELLFEEAPDWFSDIMTPNDIANSDKREAALGKQQEIKEELLELQRKIKRDTMLGEEVSMDDEVSLAVFKLLDPDPETRSTAEEFFKELGRLTGMPPEEKVVKKEPIVQEAVPPIHAELDDILNELDFLLKSNDF